MEFNIGSGSSGEFQRVDARVKGDGVVVGYAPSVAPASWVSVEELGVTEGDTLGYNIHVDPNGLSPGTYRTSLRFLTGTVFGDGDVRDITYDDLQITLTVVRFETSPRYSFVTLPEGDTTGQAGSLSLQAPDGMAWTAASTQTWLVPGKSSGTGPGSLGYSISVGDLAAGTYYGAITVNGGSGYSADFRVELTVSAPHLYVSPNSEWLQLYEADPTPVTNQFSLDTPLTLRWTATSNQPWLTVTPSGTGPGNIEYTVSTANLASGYHYGTITIADPRGRPTTFSVTVVASQAPLGVSPESAWHEMIEGDPTPTTDSFALNTLANRPWTASSNAAWLTVTTPNGTGPADIGYSVSSAALTTSYNSGTITVTDRAGRSASFGVTAYVSAPQLQAMPDHLSVAVGADLSEAGRSFPLTIADNRGGVAANGVTWKVTSVDVPWLSVSPTSGNTSGNRNVVVSVPTAPLADLSNGIHYGNIEFQYSYGSTTGTLTVPVELSVDTPVTALKVSRQNPDVANIAQGPKVPFIAKATHAHGHVEDVTSYVSWTSSDEEIVTFRTPEPAPGVAQPQAPGEAVIRARYPGTDKEDSLTLKVGSATAMVYAISNGSYYDNDSRILQYITGDDGRMQPMAAASAPLRYWANDLAFTADGKYAYAIHSREVMHGQYGISQFRVSAGGALSPMSTPTLLIGSYYPNALAVDPKGKHVYVAGGTGAGYFILRLDIGADGSLTLDAKPPVEGGRSIYSMAIDPASGRLFVPDFQQDVVRSFGIAADGALQPPSAATGVRTPQGIAVHPSGKHVYVTNYTCCSSSADGAVSQYNVMEDGQLVPMATPRLLPGKWGSSLVMAPSGKKAFAGYIVPDDNGYSGAQGIHTFAVDEQGALVPQYGYIVNNGYHFAVDPSGRFLYVRGGAYAILQYRVGDDGTLVQDSHVVTGTNPERLIVRPPPAAPQP